ncbi:CidA/LrgA family protein [Treponema sp.]|uniref:CidA/LrgA family protein n=1 Tax=Treponema sp. TaxID=166 RepID=UPI00298E38A4|nr:CidA/LrgA family protein [Treponema sp.]MCI6442629.1 CidA/LrgA family protein [Spirochaetia bacterium]MDY4133024.1 CidA/LrgA family protein [Treponema sp.]
MNYVKQFCIILAFSFTGEVLNRLIPLPVPASIYGLVLLFLTLEFKIIKVEHIKEVSKFLLGIMSIFFVPSSVGFINALPLMKKYGIQFALIGIVSTFIVFGVTGRITQQLMKIRNRKNNVENMEAQQ